MTSDREISDRVVVTGMGAVSGWGWSAEDLARGLAGGKPAIGTPERFDTSLQRTRLAAEVPAPPAGLKSKFSAWRRYSRADRFAAVAALEACEQSGFQDSVASSAIGIFFGGSTAGMAEGEDYFLQLTGGSSTGNSTGSQRRKVQIGLLAGHPLNSPGDVVARWVCASGPVQSLSSACASGALAIGAALDALRDGEVEVAVAGGSDSLCQLTYAGFNSLRIVDPNMCRPFRGEREGLNLGEGAGVVVLETLEHARQRGAQPLAEVLGAGSSCDAHHMTAPHPKGAGAARALQNALDDASLSAGEVGFINAHGTGTPQNDAAEWSAIEQIFGSRASKIPVSATKASVGHLLGSSGAIEAVATIQCYLAGRAHITPGDGLVDEKFDVDLVVEKPRPLPADGIAISTSFGFGGANAAVVFRGWPQRELS